MPYVITTYYREECYGVPNAVQSSGRVAVATLEEARNIAEGLIVNTWDRCYDDRKPGEVRGDHIRALFSLPESGGTVGPLPDGTIIEVSRVSWMDLQGAPENHWFIGTMPVQSIADHILAAFNAS